MTELTQEPQKVESAPVSSASRAALAFIFATVLFDTLGFGIIIPVLPGLVVGFVGGDTAQGAEVFGLFGSIWGDGFRIGPLVGGLLGGIGPRFPFWGASALSIASAAYGLVVLP